MRRSLALKEGKGGCGFISFEVPVSSLSLVFSNLFPLQLPSSCKIFHQLQTSTIYFFGLNPTHFSASSYSLSSLPPTYETSAHRRDFFLLSFPSILSLCVIHFSGYRVIGYIPTTHKPKPKPFNSQRTAHMNQLLRPISNQKTRLLRLINNPSYLSSRRGGRGGAVYILHLHLH